MLVEGYGAVALTHVDFKLPSGSTPSPAVIRVSQAEVTLAGTEQQAALGHKLDVQKAKQQSAKVGYVGDGLAMPVLETTGVPFPGSAADTLKGSKPC